MVKCEVLIPFHMKATNTDHLQGDIILISEEQLAKIRAINVNMVLVLGIAEEKPKRSRKKKEEGGE
jgi:hypothetical protein